MSFKPTSMVSALVATTIFLLFSLTPTLAQDLTPSWILPLAPAGYGGPGVINPYSNVNPLNPMAAEMQARAAHQPHTQSPQQELGPANTNVQTVGSPAQTTTTNSFIEVAEGTDVEKSDKKMKKATILNDMKLFRTPPFSSLHKHHSTHHTKVLFVLPVGSTTTNGPLNQNNLLPQLLASLAKQQSSQPQGGVGAAAVIQQQVEQEQQSHFTMIHLPSSVTSSLSPLAQTTSSSSASSSSNGEGESDDVVPTLSSSSSSCSSSPCSPDAVAAEEADVVSSSESLPSNNGITSSTITNNNNNHGEIVEAEVVDHVEGKQKLWTPESVASANVNSQPFASQTQTASHTCAGCSFTN